MGIVRKILGEEKLTKDDLLTIKDSVEGEITRKEKPEAKNRPKPVKKTRAPKSVEMFVRLDDYEGITSEISKFQSVIERLEELERMQAEIQDVHRKFTSKLEDALTDMEEIREKLDEKLSA